MSSSIAAQIKQDLENTYDIPFVVTREVSGTDPKYTIIPENEMGELFEISILLRQSIRMIITINPQRYAAEMVSEMSHADLEKRLLFRSYAEHIRNKGAKIDFYVSGIERSIDDDETWIGEWREFQIRVTRILVNEIEEPGNVEESVASEWSLLSVGMVLSLLTIEQSENTDERHVEGRIRQVVETKHERNPVNRELCISANGCKCNICNFDFEKVYGSMGRGFIHVHHIEMISLHKDGYYLDPVKDLIPVCPNCHAMLHRTIPPLRPDELRRVIVEGEKG